jgi:hypothetical protein
VDKDPNGWKLFIDSNPYDVNWPGTNQYHVIIWDDPCAPPFLVAGSPVQKYDNSAHSKIFDGNSTILLTRRVNGVDIVVDSKVVPGGWMTNDGIPHSIQRDISRHKCIRRLWDSAVKPPTLKSMNAYLSGDPNIIQAHPANSDFNNIGQIGMILRKPAYYPLTGLNTDIIGYNGVNNTESEVRLNLADLNFQQVFKYLTVIDPYSHASGANEKRIKGRININTAPWYVIAQLPWVSHRKNYSDANLARAIVAYRDRTQITGGPDYSDRSYAGIGSIGQLCNVNRSTDDYRIDYYSRGVMAGDQPGFPDLTSDGAADDFEERDLIFARISDLVTVRSDVFTAYILVRIGTNGPQKRYMAILDRSGVSGPTDKVYVTAFQTTPEAR